MNLISKMNELIGNISVTHLIIGYVVLVTLIVIKLCWGSRG